MEAVDTEEGGRSGGQTIGLISSDGFEFIVDEEAACVSNTIQNMLNSQGSFTEKQMGKIRFQEIQGHVLEKVCKYFYYKLRYNDASDSEQPEFPIDSSEALELLMAANFLDCVRSSTSSSLMQTSTVPPVRSLRLFSCSA